MMIYERLQRMWPATTQAICRTFHPEPTFGQTLVNGQNDAGFLYSALAKYEQMYAQRFAHRPVSRQELDRAAAGEILYQHSKRRTFNRPVAALARCIQMMVIERPEKIYGGGQPR